MKTCNQCQSSFKITPADRVVLEALSVPEPRLCASCRNIRRMAWRNDRTFYHAKSALSGKPMISMYPPETPYQIYLQGEWYDRNKWDPLDYGRDYDFNRPFFEQFAELQKVVPRMNLDIVNCENSDYCNYCGDDKNCYLDIAGESNEDCYYNLFVKYSKDTADSTFVYNSQHCYESINCHDCYNLSFAQYCNNTSDSAFVYDLVGCKNCLFSYSLRNKEYYIFNEPHSKEAFEKKRDEILNGSYESLQSALKIWYKNLKEKGIFRDFYQVNCENSTGNNLKNCKNVHYSFNATNCEDSQYLYDVLDAKNCMDLNYSLYNPELSYELISTLSLNHCAFCTATHYTSDSYYCDQSNHSKYLFGCVGVSRKEYCILNKQYSKEEYLELLAKIIDHMKSTGEWGEFFPASLSFFGYNETVAQEYHPLSKIEALAQGFKWSDQQDIKKYKGPDFIIPDNIAQVDSSLSNQVLNCEVSGKPYKVIPQELIYYKNQHLPVPHRSPHQRHLDRMSLRNPRQLWERQCDQCSNSIQTTFSPQRPEQVFCEPCYLKEIY